MTSQLKRHTEKLTSLKKKTPSRFSIVITVVKLAIVKKDLEFGFHFKVDNTLI